MSLPTPYAEGGGWVLYCGDARQILPMMERVDAIITDPVWPDATADLAGKEDPHGLLAEALACCPYASTLGIILGADSDPRILSAVPAVWKFLRVCWLRYARPHYKGRILYGADVAYVYGEPPPSRPGARVLPGEFCKVDVEPRFDHPCPRSVSHMLWLVEKLTAPGDTVLDPFAGVGTTGVAALSAERRVVLIELEERYCEIAARRLRAAERDVAERFDFAKPAKPVQLSLEESK